MNQFFNKFFIILCCKSLSGGWGFDPYGLNAFDGSLKEEKNAVDLKSKKKHKSLKKLNVGWLMHLSRARIWFECNGTITMSSIINLTEGKNVSVHVWPIFTMQA